MSKSEGAGGEVTSGFVLTLRQAQDTAGSTNLGTESAPSLRGPEFAML